MKNKTGKLVGLLSGLTGFLLMFKLIFLVRIPPEDELAPGIVIFASILCGLLLAYAGNLIQEYYLRKQNFR